MINNVDLTWPITKSATDWLVDKVIDKVIAPPLSLRPTKKRSKERTYNKNTRLGQRKKNRLQMPSNKKGFDLQIGRLIVTNYKLVITISSLNLGLEYSKGSFGE